MTPDERKSLAQQLLANPLFAEILTGIEKAAVEALVHADTEQSRVEAQWRVRSVRTFRRDCEAAARNTPERKGVKA